MRAIRGIDVIAVTTAKGNYMTTVTTEDRRAHVPGAESAKPGKKARVARKRAHVAPNQAPKAKASKKAPKDGGKAGSARDGLPHSGEVGLAHRRRAARERLSSVYHRACGAYTEWDSSTIAHVRRR